MLGIEKGSVLLMDEKRYRGVIPLIVDAYEYGRLGLPTVWECIEDQIELELRSFKPNNQKIPVLAEIWGQMLKLNNSHHDYESEKLLNRVVKMCLVTKNNKTHKNIDEGLSEISKVMAEHNIMIIGNNFPLFDLFTDIKMRNTAVCCNRQIN